MTDGVTDFSASSSATGYLYQLSWALADLLEKAHQRPDQAVTIEGADDVVWATAEGDPMELVQTKVHGAGAVTSVGLTDSAVDLWKTLRIWLSREDAFDPDGPDLTLVSTSVAPEGSATWCLQPASSGGRDVERADELLAKAARESQNVVTAPARKAYLAAESSERVVMLTRARVLDGEFGAGDVFDVVKRRLDWVLPSGGERPVSSFLEQMWGWWYRMCVQMLAGQRPAISAMEVRAFVQRLRDDFGPLSLRTTVQLGDVTPEHVALYGDFQFVQQLRWVRYSEESLRTAIIDYHRAITQETYWVDHHLLGVEELSKLEAELRFEWERAFAQMVEDLSDLVLDPDELEVAKVKYGREFARELLASAEVVLRAQYQEPFFSRGKRHALANDPGIDSAIGWHADFKKKLAALLAPPVPAT